MTNKTISYINRIKNAFKDRDYDYSLITDIPNLKVKLPIYCSKHNIVFYGRADHLIYGKNGCIECKKDSLSKLKSITQKEFIEKVNSLFDGDLTVKSKYKGNDNKIKFECKKCNTVFYRRPRDLYSSCGCPTCTKHISKIELHLIKLFNKENIDYRYQYSFEWLGRKLLDFYLPKQNIAIECQGLQHFVSKEFFGGEVGLKKKENRDAEKLKLCEENGVKLIYFANYNFDFPYDVITNDNDLLQLIKN